MPATTSRMSRTARLLTLVAAVLLGTMYVAPVWSVRLVAPQYPEGLGMYIRLHTIEGVGEHDLDNINTVNHYIGMKTIESDAIPELKFMPWIVAGLIAAGVVVAASGRRRLLVGWLASFALLGAAGLYDFWRWSYDYGHNLDFEKAVIVIPGMSYQPPLIGTKVLLNFTATSWPALGGLAAGIAFLLGAAALFISFRGMRRGSRGIAVLGTALAASACASAPHIAFGVDTCAECRMAIADRRFGAVLVTHTGKSMTFDSVDCLLEYLERNPSPDARGTWVMDASRPGMLIPAATALFVRQGALRPPMGTTVAFASLETARATAGITAETFDWQDLQSGTESVAH
jgi:copper chaperone NosL